MLKTLMLCRLNEEQIEALGDDRFRSECDGTSESVCDTYGNDADRCAGCPAWESLKDRIADGSARGPGSEEAAKPEGLTLRDGIDLVLDLAGFVSAGAVAAVSFTESEWASFAAYGALSLLFGAHFVVGITFGTRRGSP